MFNKKIILLVFLQIADYGNAMDQKYCISDVHDEHINPSFVIVFTGDDLRNLCVAKQGFYCYPKPPVMYSHTLDWELYQRTYYKILNINLHIAYNREISISTRAHYIHHVLNLLDEIQALHTPDDEYQ